jgi:UDP-glucose 4-epimerase
MNVLVTGASGFLGSHITRCLLREGHDVAVLLRPGASDWRISDCAGEVTVVRGSLELAGDLRPAVCAFEPQAVVHAAWTGTSPDDRSDALQERNVAYVDRVVSLAVTAGARTFVGLGSQAEYGRLDGRIDETKECRPATAYGRAKLAAYEHAADQCRLLGIRCAWLRLFTAYGPADQPGPLIPSVILGLLRHERMSLTEGRQLWDPLYVEDAARAVAAATEQTRCAGVFNLGLGETLSVRSTVERIRDLVDPSAELDFGAKRLNGSESSHLEADTSALSAVTGWSPQMSIAEGLGMTVSWFRRNAWRYPLAASS